MTNQPAFGSATHDRIIVKSEILTRMIDRCSQRELEMLVRYYLHNQNEKQVIREMGVSKKEFSELRARMRRSVFAEDRPKSKGAAAP